MPIATSQYPASFSLVDLDGFSGFILNGINPPDESGNSVASAGDINGDGIDDLIIGARYANSYAGQSYVVFGHHGPWASQLVLDGTNGFVLNGINSGNNEGQQGDQSGYSVASAGDINGDGVSDLIIGAPQCIMQPYTYEYQDHQCIGSGQSYVVFGHRGPWSSPLNLLTLNGINGFVLTGNNSWDQSGLSVASAGDVNGDGLSDLIIGAPQCGQPYPNLYPPYPYPDQCTGAGQSYVVFGSNHSWSANMSLSSLNGTNGFVLNGIFLGDQSGYSVASAGDVNGDNIDDLIIGAPYAYNQAGQSYVVFGSRDPWNSIFDLAALNGTNGFFLNYINPGDHSGWSVASAGDVNGDNIDDLIIGAPHAYNQVWSYQAGQSYVVFGSRDPWNSIFDLAALNGTNGFFLNGINPRDRSGWSVASAGDVNDDNITDIIIGAPYANNNVGQSYVVFGHRELWVSQLSLSALNGTNGFTLNGINPIGLGDRSGWSVASAGDVNGDNITDIIIGALNANDGTGQSYVIFGTRNFKLISNQLTITNGGFVVLNSTYLSIDPILNTTLFLISELTHGQFELVSQPGFPITKFNQSELSNQQVVFYHDGSGAAPQYAINCSNGLNTIMRQTASINFIAATKPPLLLGRYKQYYNLSSLNGTNGMILNGRFSGEESGLSLASAGDINGDDIDDLIIGAPDANSYAGQSYVIFGSRDVWNASMSLSDLNGNSGFTLNGINAHVITPGSNPYGDQSGTSVASAGDVNGDGFDDLLISAPQAPGGNPSGQCYVVLGHPDPWSAQFSLSTLNGINGFTLNGINPSDAIGNSVGPAGDVNGDGVSDLIIGAPETLDNNKAGQSYVVFGSRDPWSSTFNLASLNGTNGFILEGINSNDQSGYSVASAGDINGDGLSDLIIGAPSANNKAGQSYVVFGHSDPWASSLSLLALNGTNGFILNGVNGGNSGTYSAYSVASAGDINGDGLSDLLIGAPYTLQSYVVFGSRDPWSSTFNLASLNGTNGFVLKGINSDDLSGQSVASAGDVNGDGLSDLLIGAYNANNGAGQSYVVFGSRSNWPAHFNLSTLDGTNGFILNGIHADDQSGQSVASAGDVNGDGLSDLLIGAYNANNKAGQSYLVFSTYPFMQLAVNQLKISNGQSVFVTSAMLSIRSFSYSRHQVQFSISNITHGWFESTNGNSCSAVRSSANNITAFTQAQVDASEIIFTHDGSLNPPSYCVSAASLIGLPFILTPKHANITFDNFLSIKSISFKVNQYQRQIDLSNSNVLAVDTLHNDTAQIIFKVNSLQNGWFANINNTALLLPTFSQAEVNQGKICFYSPCGVNSRDVLPGFTLSVAAPENLNAAPEIGNVTYNPAPFIINNAITVSEQQTVIVNINNIAAKDTNSSNPNAAAWLDPSIKFSVLNITGGHFQFVQNRSFTSSFYQSDVKAGAIQFISDTISAPSYSLTATDTEGATSSPPLPVTVTFNQAGASLNNTATIAAATAIGGVAAAGVGLFLLNRRNNNRLHDYIAQASNKDNSLNKIAEVIFEKIKLTGFLNHIQKNRVTEYVNAIKEILEALTAMGFPVDLATMTEKSRGHFLAEFPRQIKGAFPVSQQSRMQFFKAEITPRQIKSEASHIASNIKHLMDKIESQILDDDLEGSSDIPLTDVSNHSGGRSDDLHELLMQDGGDNKKSRVSKCCVM